MVTTQHEVVTEDSDGVAESEPPGRHSNHDRRPPVRLGDYVTSFSGAQTINILDMVGEGFSIIAINAIVSFASCTDL